MKLLQKERGRERGEWFQIKMSCVETSLNVFSFVACNKGNKRRLHAGNLPVNLALNLSKAGNRAWPPIIKMINIILPSQYVLVLPALTFANHWLPFSIQVMLKWMVQIAPNGNIPLQFMTRSTHILCTQLNTDHQNQSAMKWWGTTRYSPPTTIIISWITRNSKLGSLTIKCLKYRQVCKCYMRFLKCRADWHF